MKPFLAICVILILFQTLIFGSLVKIDIADNYQDRYSETLIKKQISLDPFLIPGKEGFSLNYQNKNEWIPFHFNNTFLTKTTSVLPKINENLQNPGKNYNYTTIPVFIIYRTLRI